MLPAPSCPPSAGNGWGTYRSWTRTTRGRFGTFPSPQWSQPGTNWSNTKLCIELTTRLYRLHQMLPAHSQACWRCSYQPGDFFHIFWVCPAIEHYWKEVLQVIAEVTKTCVPYDPKYCLLGLVEQMSTLKARKILISLLLYYACKAITMNWKQLSPPLSDSGKA